MAEKFYAIKEGYDSKLGLKIENKIVRTWAECQLYTKGVKGAKYKSFEDEKSANKYLYDTKKLLKKGVDEYPEDCLHVYVDGSYNSDTQRYSYGVVAVRNSVVEYIEGFSPESTHLSNIRQIAGELTGAIKAVKYALSKGEKKMVLFHDYLGVFEHSSYGSWERKDETSKTYHKIMNDLFSQGIEVIFVKVDSHTGDLYNELVDEVCKSKLNISSDNIVEGWLAKDKIFVSHDVVKKQMCEFVLKNTENIIVKEDCINQDKFMGGIDEKIISMLVDLNDGQKNEVLKYIENIKGRR